MKVVDIIVKEKESKKGNKYKAIYAVLEDGKEIFLAFVR